MQNMQLGRICIHRPTKAFCCSIIGVMFTCIQSLSTLLGTLYWYWVGLFFALEQPQFFVAWFPHDVPWHPLRLFVGLCCRYCIMTLLIVFWKQLHAVHLIFLKWNFMWSSTIVALLPPGSIYLAFWWRGYQSWCRFSISSNQSGHSLLTSLINNCLFPGCICH